MNREKHLEKAERVEDSIEKFEKIKDMFKNEK